MHFRNKRDIFQRNHQFMVALFHRISHVGHRMKY